MENPIAEMANVVRGIVQRIDPDADIREKQLDHGTQLLITSATYGARIRARSEAEREKIPVESTWQVFVTIGTGEQFDCGADLAVEIEHNVFEDWEEIADPDESRLIYMDDVDATDQLNDALWHFCRHPNSSKPTNYPRWDE